MRRMTPLQLHLMLQAATSPTYNGIELLKINETWQKQFQELVEDEMIIPITMPLPDSINCWPWQLSDKGKYWFNYILAIPFPVSEWKIPNEHSPS
jgi:hypothetical protein